MTTGRITVEWASLPESERRARLRALQIAVRLCNGSAGDVAAKLLSEAENNLALLPAADAALLRLSATGLRRSLSSYLRSLPEFRRQRARRRRVVQPVEVAGK